MRKISKDTIWGEAVDSITYNFAEIQNRIIINEQLNPNFKGYFSSIDILQKTITSPSVGNYAWAGTPYPGVVVQCNTKGVWSQTSKAPDDRGTTNIYNVNNHIDGGNA